MSDKEVPFAPHPQLVEQLYSVPLETPIGRELFVVMASLLAHVLNVDSTGFEHPHPTRE
jgi:type III secretion system FlhB-like substrate exporter